MVKSIYVDFDDPEHARLKEAKGEKSWHDFIMTLAPTEAPRGE